MAPGKKETKKEAKKEKKKKASENDVMHNVDKAFYEIQITDLNRKLARQKARVVELEETVIQQDTKLSKINDDHMDIISYLKRNLNERNTEVTDLQSKIATLSELNAAQQENHEKQIEKFNEEYNSMKEILTSKVKTLTGQLNALDDYRMHREELLSKFEEVQNELDAQELKFKKQIYEMEKKTILGKELLKREMEERMYNLATKYQEANQIRIAATSQRIVRENIALNNEMNTLIMSTNDLDYENLLIKQQFKKVVTDYRILEQAQKKTLHKVTIQSGVIRDLTHVNLRQKSIIDNFEAEIHKGFENKRKLHELLENERLFNNKIKELETRLNATRYAERDLETQLNAANKFKHHLELIVEDVRLLVKSTLFEHPELLQKVEIPNEKNIFTAIIDIVTYSKSDILPPTPCSTVSSISTSHPKSESKVPQGQLFVERKPSVKKLNVMTHLGASFQDFLRNQTVKSESVESVHLEKSTSELLIVDTRSEETIVSEFTDEQTSSTTTDGSNEPTTAATTGYENDAMEEELEEEIMEEEKMDEEKVTDDFDGNN